MIRAVRSGCLALLLGCAAAPTREAVPPILVETPFFPGDSYQCGPASLASVLKFFGKDTTPDGLKNDIFIEGLQGSLTTDLLIAARKRGLSAELVRGDLDRMRAEIRASRPTIALLNLGYRSLPKGHYVVVTGFDDSAARVRMHSGKHQNQWMSYRSFLKKWERADNVLLVFDAKP